MKLARINTLLVVAIVLTNGFVIVSPFVPRLLFRWQASTARQQQLGRQLHDGAAHIAADNRLIIPDIALDQHINEGRDLSAARTGPWRLPYTSAPDKGGNTVIIGHRFTYTNPRGTFYSLDKLKAGDEIGLYWQGKKYLYKVTRTTVVPPTQREVEAPTADTRLTLYTCTPLWWPKNRLVVTAQPEGAGV